MISLVFYRLLALCFGRVESHFSHRFGFLLSTPSVNAQAANRLLRRSFAVAPVMTLTAGVMAADLIVCVCGLVFDHAMVTGAPAWIKPTKFALSTGIYALSLAVVIGYTLVWRRALRVMEGLIGTALTLEIVLIDWQAARHVASHFNVGTLFDRLIWNAMAAGIAVFWLCSVVVAVATFRARYASPAWTLAVRAGMGLIVLTGLAAMPMTVPSRAQIEAARVTHSMPKVGAHTFGGADSGPGLPVVNWSTQHGDGRVCHFLGLHGLQVFALLTFVLGRRRVPSVRAHRIVLAAVLSYGGLFLIAFAEAVRGRPITSHDATSTAVWLAWAAASVVLLVWAARLSGESGEDSTTNDHSTKVTA